MILVTFKSDLDVQQTHLRCCWVFVIGKFTQAGHTLAYYTWEHIHNTLFSWYLTSGFDKLERYLH
jgi:hypothetical protein